MGVSLPPKKYRFGKKCRDEMMAGIELMRNCVTATLGPNGRNVAIDRYMINDITKDGVTVLGDVVADDSFAEMGCKMVREASTKTNDEAGDGTTTAIEVAWALCEAGRKRVETGTNVIKLQTGMQVAIDAVVAALDKQAIKVESTYTQRYVDIATISAQDAKIGKEVTDIFLKSGENGVIDVERVDKPGIESEHTDGMQITEGWLRHEFINDYTNLTYSMDEVPVVITDREITAIPELACLDMLARKGIKKCVIICDDCNGEALATCAKNARFGSFHVCVIKAPAWGARKAEILKDIAAMTGATVISEETGLNMDQIDITHIGYARQVTAKQKKTIFISDKDHIVQNPATGEQRTIGACIAERVEMLTKTIEVTEEGYEKDKLKERLANLTDGVSIIKLGANTEIERILMKRRVEDAIRAVQCAKEEGVVAGGGAALLHCVKALEEIHLKDPDEQMGVEIVKEAIHSPARRILEVAGVEPTSAPWYYRLTKNLRKKWTKKCQDKIIEKVKALPDTFGYLMSEPGYEFASLVIEGIVDPKKVVRTAFTNGASCAKTFLSCEVAITPIPEKDPALNPLLRK